MERSLEARIWADRFTALSDLSTALYAEDGEPIEGFEREREAFELLLKRFMREAEQREPGIVVMRLRVGLENRRAWLGEFTD